MEFLPDDVRAAVATQQRLLVEGLSPPEINDSVKQAFIDANALKVVAPEGRVSLDNMEQLLLSFPKLETDQDLLVPSVPAMAMSDREKALYREVMQLRSITFALCTAEKLAELDDDKSSDHAWAIIAALRKKLWLRMQDNTFERLSALASPKEREFLSAPPNALSRSDTARDLLSAAKSAAAVFSPPLPAPAKRKRGIRSRRPNQQQQQLQSPPQQQQLQPHSQQQPQQAAPQGTPQLQTQQLLAPPLVSMVPSSQPARSQPPRSARSSRGGSGGSRI